MSAADQPVGGDAFAVLGVDVPRGKRLFRGTRRFGFAAPLQDAGGGVALGQWVFSQRAIYNGDRTGLLNERRIALLDAIGMNWSYVRDSGWENGFEHAEAYKAQHGDLLVPAVHICEDGFKLGIWLTNQRTAYRSF